MVFRRRPIRFIITCRLPSGYVAVNRVSVDRLPRQEAVLRIVLRLFPSVAAVESRPAVLAIAVWRAARSRCRTRAFRFSRAEQRWLLCCS